MVLLNKYSDTFLIDKDFLRLLDLEKNKEVFARIITLDFNENPLEEITGRVTQGSINVDGTSSVRRTCSITLVASELNIHNFYWGLNTKFKLEIGVQNVVKEHEEYKEQYHLYPDICWFKMGTYIISTFTTNQSTNQYTITVQGKDKMALLNGEVGGVITPLTWDFGKIDEIDEDGYVITKDYRLKDIILESVHEHAQEPYWNIIVNDLDDYGLELLEYRGDQPMYLVYNCQEEIVEQMSFSLPAELIGGMDPDDIKYDYRITNLKGNFDSPTIFVNPEDVDKPVDEQRTYTIMKAEYGDTVGYRTTDLTYAGDLISNVGETVTSMLDKIVQMLGNFEYFYDLDGRFIFQRKKTYLQSTLSPITQNDVDTNEIFVQNAAEISTCVYSFDNSVLVTSFQNAPKFSDIKNDFSLWGIKKSTTGIEAPIHLRYAIESKPWIYTGYNGITYITPEGKERYERQMNEYEAWIRERPEGDLGDRTVFKKIAVPTFLRNINGSSDWWDITNWAEYYFLITGNYPTLPIGEYGTEGFIGELEFPDGTLHTFSGRGQLVIDLERDTHNLFYGNGPEVNSNGRKLGYKRTNTLTQELEEFPERTWSPLQHGFEGCWHTYLEFIDLDANNNCQSFIYKPSIPDAEMTGRYIEMIDTIIIDDLGLDEEKTMITDWRELIYQMSLDYNLYHHNEDFLIQLDKNNTLPDDTHVYLGGYTGYEQYYIDINGFWRDLYNPYYNYNYIITAPTKTQYNANRDIQNVEDPDTGKILYPNGRYFIYQNCTDMSYDDLLAAIEVWEPYCGDSVYFINQSTLSKQALSNVPSRETYEAHPEKYYFIRGCQALRFNNETESTPIPAYRQALKYDKNESYFDQYEDKYNKDTHWAWDVTNNPENLNFWFDFLDTEGDLNQYKVCNIGDRTKANNDSNIKSIYFRDVPTVIFVDVDTDIAEEKKKKGSGYTYIKLPTYLENLFAFSTQGKSAMDVLDEWLYQYAYCAESITLNALPVYYLEPNTRIMVRDDNSGINGEYIVTRLTFPLTHNGTMSISATKAVENLY